MGQKPCELGMEEVAQGLGSCAGVVIGVSGWSPTAAHSQQSPVLLVGETATETHPHLVCDQKEGLQAQREDRVRDQDNGSLSQAKENL